MWKGSLLLLFIVSLAPSPSRSADDPASDLAQARALWEASGGDGGYQNYDFVYDLSCECDSEQDDPKLVLVRGGLVDSVTFLETGAPYEQGNVWTINDLFDEIQKAIDEGRPQIDVDYNETYGFPTSIFIDYELNIADEEFIIAISDFVPLQDEEEAAAPSANEPLQNKEEATAPSASEPPSTISPDPLQIPTVSPVAFINDPDTSSPQPTSKGHRSFTIGGMMWITTSLLVAIDRI